MTVLQARVSSGLTHMYNVDELFNLYPVYKHSDLGAIEDSLTENGMEYPIVVWHTTGLAWKLMWQKQPDDLERPPNYMTDPMIIDIVLCGNNRHRAAINLGYKYIEGLRVDTFEEAQSICGGQRKWWMNQQKLQELPKSQKDMIL